MGEKCILLRHRLRLYEELVERGVLAIRVVRRHRELDVGRQIETARPEGTVYHRHTPDLDVIFRCNDDFGLTFDVAVDAPEHRPVNREVGAESFNAPPDGLVGIAPETAGIRVTNVAECPPGILCPVRPPARDLDVAPVAVAAPAFVTIRQYRPLERSCVRGVDVLGVSNWLTERAVSPTAATDATRTCSET